MLFFPTSTLIFALFIIILFIEHSGYITILISHYIYIYIYINNIYIYIYINNIYIYINREREQKTECSESLTVETVENL